MEQSIFTALSWDEIKIAWQTAKGSPEGLAAVAIVAVVALAAVGFAAMMISHHVSGFYAHVEREDEIAREEEEQEKARLAETQTEEP